jgi:hypothetical protein
MIVPERGRPRQGNDDSARAAAQEKCWPIRAPLRIEQAGRPVGRPAVSPERAPPERAPRVTGTLTICRLLKRRPFMLRALYAALRRGARRRSLRPTGRFTPALETLEARAVPAVTAFFSPAFGVLAVTGDNLNNTIEISRNAAGTILVNGGAVAVLGGTPTVANTATISVLGLGGNDTLRLNEANGALPAAVLFGGTGNDTLEGGCASDQDFGQEGNDTLLCKR